MPCTRASLQCALADLNFGLHELGSYSQSGSELSWMDMRRCSECVLRVKTAGSRGTLEPLLGEAGLVQAVTGNSAAGAWPPEGDEGDDEADHSFAAEKGDDWASSLANAEVSMPDAQAFSPCRLRSRQALAPWLTTVMQHGKGRSLGLSSPSTQASAQLPIHQREQLVRRP